MLTEEVTWPGLSDTVLRRGGSVHGLPVGSDGLDVVALEESIVRLRPLLVAINPHHRNPTGTRVPPTLAAERSDAPILVAESVSKWAWAGLRVGWLRADPVLVRRLPASRQLVDQSTNVPAQLLALDLIEQAPALRREVSAHHARMLGVMRDLLDEHLPNWSYTPPRGGLSLWARLPEPRAEELIRLAAIQGVAIAGTRTFAVGPFSDDRVRLPLTLPEPMLHEAIRRLWEAWRELG